MDTMPAGGKRYEMICETWMLRWTGLGLRVVVDMGVLFLLLGGPAQGVRAGAVYRGHRDSRGSGVVVVFSVFSVQPASRVYCIAAT
jgi:hypothetical protein